MKNTLVIVALNNVNAGILLTIGRCCYYDAICNSIV